MSLLAQVNQPNGNKDASGNPQYYFAVDRSPADPTVTAPNFTATGGDGNAPPGVFNSVGNSVSGGTVSFSMTKPNAAAQWGIGMANAPGGANSGNDFAIYSYDDNGAFLSGPLGIVRATGGVITQNGLTTTTLVATGAASLDSAIIGENTTVGGGDLQVNGTLGVAQVYDSIYNRPNPGTETLVSGFNNVGVQNFFLPGGYVPSTSGLYSVTMEVTADAAGGFAWTNGVACIMGSFQGPFPPFPLLSDSFLACDSLANPTGMQLPVDGGTVINNVYKKDLVALVNLTAGTAYTAQINFTGAFNLGTTGGIKFFVQPLLA